MGRRATGKKCCLSYESYGKKQSLRKNKKFSNVRVDGVYMCTIRILGLNSRKMNQCGYAYWTS